MFIEVETAMAQINDTSDRHYSKRILKRLYILKTMLKRSLKSFSMDDSDVPRTLPHPETPSMYYFMLGFSSNLKILTLLAQITFMLLHKFDIIPFLFRDLS